MAQPVSPWAQIDGTQPSMLPPPTSPVWAAMPPDPHSGPVMPPAPVQRVALASQSDPSNPFSSIPEYQAPQVGLTADPLQRIEGSEQNKLEADQRKDANPWGTPENHPGKLGKLAHVLSNIGNVAGDIAIPRVMANIPGTQLNRLAEEQGLKAGIGSTQAEEAENSLKGAQAAGAEEATKEAPGKANSIEALQGAEADKDRQPPADKYTFQQTDHGLMRIDSATGAATPVTYNGQPLNPIAKPEAPKGAEHVSLLGDDGKPILANYHPDTGKYTDINGKEIANPRPVPPPPSYGQLILPTKTQQMLVNGIPTVMGWDEKTQQYDIPQGQSATGTYAHQEAQAGADVRAGESLISDLQANREKLGTLSTWVQKYGLNTPIADPTLAGLQAELSTFSALQPALHGFRSHSALETFDKIIGGLQKNPDATIASIRGILKTAQNINPNLNNNGNPPPKAGQIIDGHRFKGGNPGDPKNWEKQ